MAADMFTQMRSVFTLQRALANERALAGDSAAPGCSRAAKCWSSPRSKALAARISIGRWDR
jgi:hypothetical protein